MNKIVHCLELCEDHLLTTRCLAFRRARASLRHLSRSTRGLSSTSAARSAARARRNAAAAVLDTGRPRPACAARAADDERSAGAVRIAAGAAELSPLRRALDRTLPRSDMSRLLAALSPRLVPLLTPAARRPRPFTHVVQG